MIFGVYNQGSVKENQTNTFWITVLRFSDEQVLKDMENVIWTTEFYIFEFEKHTPSPSQEGSWEGQKRWGNFAKLAMK